MIRNRITIEATSLSDPMRTGIGRLVYSILNQLANEQFDKYRFGILAGRRICDANALKLMRRSNISDLSVSFPSRQLWHQMGMRFQIHKFGSSCHLGTEGLLPPYLRIPSAVIVNDLIWHDFPGSIPRHIELLLRCRFKSSVRSASKIFCISEFTRARVLEVCGVDGQKVSVIRPSIEDVLTPDLEESRNDCLFNPGPVFLAIGNALPHKNLTLLMQAALILHQRGKVFKVVIVGSGASAALKQFSEAIPAIETFEYVDDSQLRKLYSAATAIVIPSLSEGFGLPVLEAMQFDRPFLFADAGALPEVAGEAGMKFSPHDAGSLADCMQRLIEDPSRIDHLQAMGRQRKRYFIEKETFGTGILNQLLQLC